MDAMGAYNTTTPLYPTANVSTATPKLGPLVSDVDKHIVDVVFFVSFNGVVGLLGSVGNVINIIVFLRQGFKDTVNISLLCLSVSDLGSLVTLVWESITVNPLFMGAELSFDSGDVSYLTAAVPHAIFVRVAWWITAFVTLERCLCIAMPLKVKQMITARRTVAINVVFFAGTLIGLCPIFLCRTLRPEFNEAKNRTIVVTVKADGFFDIENIGFTFNVVSQFSAFIIDVVCTVTIIQILQMKSKWRSETASTSASGAKAGFESRDKRLIKMIAFISCIFIGCSMPSCLNYAVTVTLDEYARDPRYYNVNRISWAVIVALEAINSSVNVFVYYNMSGKYRTAFNELFFGKDSAPKLKAEKQ